MKKFIKLMTFIAVLMSAVAPVQCAPRGAKGMVAPGVLVKRGVGETTEQALARVGLSKNTGSISWVKVVAIAAVVTGVYALVFGPKDGKDGEPAPQVPQAPVTPIVIAAASGCSQSKETSLTVNRCAQNPGGFLSPLHALNEWVVSKLGELQ